MWLCGSRGCDVRPWRPPPLFSTRPPSLMRPPRMMGAFARAVDESAADSGSSTPAEARGQRRRDHIPSSVPCISGEPVEKRRRSEGVGRHQAMEIFCDIATTFFIGVPAVEKVAVNEHGFLPASASVQAMLAPKATATLCKRMCSMRMYIGSYNLSRLPQSVALFEEAHVFTYLKELHNDGAPASRGAALCEAINFVGGLVCVSTLSASRAECVACAAHLLYTRAATRQRRPLTVITVMELEKPSPRLKEEEDLMLLLLGRPCLLSTAGSGWATFGGVLRSSGST